ncbi:MAG: ferrochelatase [Thermodesulfovibrionia bacterium]
MSDKDNDKDKETIGVVLLNLGGPDSLCAVKPFLFNLFSDREIIKLGPPFLQKPLAWLISNLRSKKTEKMYGLIGGKSPILDITKAQADALEKALNREPPPPIRSKTRRGEERVRERVSGVKFKVYIGMRYWHPYIVDTVERIQNDRIQHLIVLSLYPHYSKTTTGSAVSEFKHAVARFTIQDLQPIIKYIEQWYDFPQYIDSLAELMGKGISEFKGNDFDVLYSAHSLPEAFIREGDPYLDHIKATILEINKRLSLGPYNITGLKWHLSFQSKTGTVKWLEPSTEEAIIKLSNEGCKNLFVMPISFVSDHIETLYEIDVLYKGIAEKHGINLKRCQALNTSEKFIAALKELVMKKVEEK